MDKIHNHQILPTKYIITKNMYNSPKESVVNHTT